MSDILSGLRPIDLPDRYVTTAAYNEALDDVAEALCNPTDEQVEYLCEVMHDAYEAAALTTGWETQSRSRKPWSSVPEANKATMRVAVRAVLAAAAGGDE